MIKIEAKEERYLYNAYHMLKAFYASEEIEQCCKKNQKEDLKLTETDGTVQTFMIDTDCTDCVNDIRRELDREVYRYLADRMDGIRTGSIYNRTGSNTRYRSERGKNLCSRV